MRGHPRRMMIFRIRGIGNEYQIRYEVTVHGACKARLLLREGNGACIAEASEPTWESAKKTILLILKVRNSKPKDEIIEDE